MLELILNKTNPKAIILRDVDSILCTGAIIAEEFFPNECYDDGNDDESHTSFVPQIYAVGNAFEQLRELKTVSFTEDFNHEQSSKDHMVLIQGSQQKGMSDDISIGDKLKIWSKDLLKQEINEDNIEELGLNLTPDEQSILQGKCAHQEDGSVISKAKTLAMRTIVRVSSIPLLASETQTKLIPIKSAHIDGVTFIGTGGLRFVEELVRLGGKVEVPTSLNSQSVDRRRWKDLGVDSDFASNANRVGDAYLKLGCNLSFTCAPYLLPTSKPAFGDQIMWGESNAVVYANSVIGARTEKYADYYDICAALIGKTVLTGVHLDQNRQPGIILDASAVIRTIFLDEASDHHIDIDSFFPTMGWLCGTLSDGKVPLILGFELISSMISDDDFKSFCAAYGTTGTAPLFHMAGVTPEAADADVVNKMLLHVGAESRTTTLDMQQVKESFETLNGFDNNADDVIGKTAETVDLIAFGNPHLSISEMKRLVDLIQLDSKQKHKDTKVIATLSRTIYEKAHELGYVTVLEDFGVKFVNDTCWCMMTDEPIIPPSKDAIIMTNSAKYAHYGVGLTQRKLRFGSMSDCVSVAKHGSRPLLTNQSSYLPSWLNLSKRSFMSFIKRVR